MKRSLLFILFSIFAVSVYAQDGATFTGTVFVYGSGLNTRTASSSFTFRLDGQTSSGDLSRYVSLLQDDGQDGLLKAIQGQKVGTFSIGGQVARDVNAAHVSTVEGGKTRIRAVFARWIGFGELRGGYRSTDYPFSYIELFIDPKTGKGEGTFIAAARIRYKEKNGQNEVEIEDFGTFPGKLMGVQMRGRMSS